MECGNGRVMILANIVDSQIWTSTIENLFSLLTYKMFKGIPQERNIGECAFPLLGGIL